MPGMACVCAGDDGERGKRGSGFSSSMGGRIVRDDGAPHGAERHDLFGRGNRRASFRGASGDAGARAPGSSPRLLVRAESPHRSHQRGNRTVLFQPVGLLEGRKVWRQPEPDFSAWRQHGCGLARSASHNRRLLCDADRSAEALAKADDCPLPCGPLVAAVWVASTGGARSGDWRKKCHRISLCQAGDNC